STTEPEEPVGTRYETRGYLIVATSISSKHLAGLRKRTRPSGVCGPEEDLRRSRTVYQLRRGSVLFRFPPRATSICQFDPMPDRNAESALRQRFTRARQAVQDHRGGKRCLTRLCRGRVALDLVVQAGLGQEGNGDCKC